MIKFILIIVAIVALGLFFKTESSNLTTMLSVVTTIVGILIGRIKVT